MLKNAPNLNYLWAALMVEELIRNGSDAFFVSPGSRSAPLAMAVASNSRAKSIVHFDERGTAFHALGHAKATGRPAVFICSSGTAVANAMPAAVEASLSHVPLILLTADRPPELLDTGANQAIDQVKFFGGYVRWHHVLPCPDIHVPPQAVLTAIDQAVYRATGRPPGPVHINCMYREPLAPTPEDYGAGAYTANIEAWLDGKRPYTRYVRAASPLDDAARNEITGLLSAKKPDSENRRILVVGQLESQDEIDAAERLANALQWPTLPDVTSSLQFRHTKGPLIPHYDPLLLTRWKDELARAEVLLQVGGPIVSKRLLAFIESDFSGTYIRVAAHPERHDPVHKVAFRYEAALDQLMHAVPLFTAGHLDQTWVANLNRPCARIDDTIETFLEEQGGLNEIGVVRAVMRHAPKDSILFLGNSMPIRQADMFGALTPSRIRVAANRGASGIDGNIATAAGCATAAGRPTAADTPVTAILGDLAALHDLNSLALLRSCPHPVVLVIINNDGGGVFSFLPIASFPEHFEGFFGAPHGLSFERIAGVFDLDYAKPGANSSFVEAYKAACQRKRPTIIEVVTVRAQSVAIHRQLEKVIEATLDDGYP